MATITYLTKIQFDFGAVQLLAGEMAELGMTRPLLVTDKGVRTVGLLDKVMEHLPKQCPAEIFDATPENPTEAAMTVALAQYREAGCDGLIGVGGGSSMDLAKAIALMATHPGELSEYMSIMGGAPKITVAMAPVIAIPTTAGTGSEVGRGAIIILDDGRKLGFGSPHVIPKVAICDPELTFSMPKMLTAGTGMDAFAHCFETFCGSAINPSADAIATDGLGRAIRFIEQAVADGSDPEACWQMMTASMEGAMAFQKGLGAVHGMSHPLGSIQDPILHHGTLNAVCLPAVIRYNADAVGDKYGWVKQIWGLPANVDLADEVAALNARLGLPADLREMGLDEAMIEPLIPHAVADHTTATNPKPLTADDYRALFMETLG